MHVINYLTADSVAPCAPIKVEEVDLSHRAGYTDAHAEKRCNRQN
jgi:hypothetical protein